MRVLVFGDSITQGFWDIDGGWVARLRKHYDELQISDLRNLDEPSIFNLGISGGSSDGLLKRFDNEVRARDNNKQLAIIISIGVNDSHIPGKKQPYMTPEEYKNNLKELISRAKKYSSKIIFVGLVAVDEFQTTPVFWIDISYTNERIKMFEDQMKKAATEEKVVFVPIFDKFKAKLDAGVSMLADGLHPNENGHKFIYELVLPQADKLFK